VVTNRSGTGVTTGDASASELSTPDSGTWMLQSDAAAAAGCSVSAIRKWRRLGVVAERTRSSPGGMRRVEVRLEDVLNRMRQSMPHEPAAPPESAGADASASIAFVTVGDLDVFVHHIAEAERRAAQAEARSQAKDAMIQFLKQRVADMEAQLQRSSQELPSPDLLSIPAANARRLAAEIRDLRIRFHRSLPSGGSPNSDQKTAARLSYDAALICLCLLFGIDPNVRLGEGLTSSERTKIAHALQQSGLDLAG
jgi:hypothetical protein